MLCSVVSVSCWGVVCNVRVCLIIDGDSYICPHSWTPRIIAVWPSIKINCSVSKKYVGCACFVHFASHVILASCRIFPFTTANFVWIWISTDKAHKLSCGRIIMQPASQMARFLCSGSSVLSKRHTPAPIVAIFGYFDETKAAHMRTNHPQLKVSHCTQKTARKFTVGEKKWKEPPKPPFLAQSNEQTRK